MITKEQYLEALVGEMEIMKHLAEKIKPEQLTHKPTEPQRTLLELMHYLTYIFIAGTDGSVHGDGSAWKKYVEAPMPTLENFSELMDKQITEVRKHLNSVDEEALKEEANIWGRTQSKALHLLGLLKMASAYKMQLFLYMKQSGTENIGTMNLWAGMDQPPKVQ